MLLNERFLYVAQACAVRLLENGGLPDYVIRTSGFIMNNLIELYAIYQKMKKIDIKSGPFIFLKSIRCLINTEYSVMK